MIPRFIVLNAPDYVIEELTGFGYEISQTPLSSSVLILGKSILNSTTVPEVVNPLIKVFDFKGLDRANRNKLLGDVYSHAKLQLRWTSVMKKKELLLGAEKKGKVIVSPVGIMIDSCVISIESVLQIKRNLETFIKPLLATHIGHINPDKYFITVGCDDYSLGDLSTIISTYSTLLEPAS